MRGLHIEIYIERSIIHFVLELVPPFHLTNENDDSEKRVQVMVERKLKMSGGIDFKARFRETQTDMRIAREKMAMEIKYIPF